MYLVQPVFTTVIATRGSSVTSSNLCWGIPRPSPWLVCILWDLDGPKMKSAVYHQDQSGLDDPVSQRLTRQAGSEAGQIFEVSLHIHNMRA